jgi:hypothetical protein
MPPPPHARALRAVVRPGVSRAGKAGSRRGGFALLITITLVAFLVLLLVSLATLVRVETQVASNGQQLGQARQNALAALNIALGELQKYAGPDQRATARAEVGAPVDGARQWTGVWANAANPQSGASSTPVLLQWLVSGNQGTNFNPDAAVSAAEDSFGRIVATPAAPVFDPAQEVDGLSAGMSGMDTVTIAGKEAVLLVGAGTTGAAAVSGYVAAPLVDIKVSPATVPGVDAAAGDVRLGRYAYWIADEGVKARVNVVDPYVTPTDAMTAAGVVADADSVYRLMAPQRFGVEQTAGLENYPVNEARLRQVFDLSQSALIAPGPGRAAFQEAFHDVTSASVSVLADGLRGGLKRDLTYAFARDALPEFHAVIRDPWRTISTTAANPLLSGALDRAVTDATVTQATLASEQGPTWEQLRSYARLGGELDLTGRVTPRIQSAGQQGIYPVLVQARLGFLGGKTVDGSAPDMQRFIFRMSPVFVLANPYNVTITGGKYRVRAIFDSAGAGYGVYRGRVSTPIWRKPLRELFDGQVYELNCPDLAPGQARLFTLAQDETWAAEKVYQFDNEWAETFISLDTEAEVTDAQMRTDGLHAVFSDNGSQTSWRANGTIDSAGAVDGTLTWALTNETDDVYQRISNHVARGSGASVYDGGFFNTDPAGEPRDDPQVRGYFMFKLGDTGNFTGPAASYNELTSVRVYPYYALANLRAPMIARTGWQENLASPKIYSSVIYSQQFLKSATNDTFRRWLRFGDSDPFSSAEVEWQGVLREGSLGSGSTSLAQARMRWPMADIPREPDGPLSGLVSIGQLQHFNAGGYNDGQILPPASSPLSARPVSNFLWRARYVGSPNPIGNSRVNAYVRRDLVRTRWPATGNREPYYDQSYLLNRQLFDGHFFSTYPQDPARSFDLKTDRLANSSLVPFRNDVAASDPEAFRGADSAFDARDVFLPARNLLQRGGFNINSTSVAAWRALLGSLAGAELNGESGLTGPFVRSVHQTGGSAGAADGISENAWTGFRNLTPGQLDALAAAIVAEIKKRGPSLGLADFINRKLVSDSAADAELGLSGPLQAAIDAAGINNAVATQIKNWDDVTIDISTTETGHAIFPYPAQVPSHPLEGIAGWLSQADIVQALAPLMTARSDTFRVRTYGETRNPVTQEITGRAWCEATVQRLPDYLDAAGNDARDSRSALTPTNQRFGRKFMVTGFRWLGPDEI